MPTALHTLRRFLARTRRRQRQSLARIEQLLWFFLIEHGVWMLKQCARIRALIDGLARAGAGVPDYYELFDQRTRVKALKAAL